MNCRRFTVDRDLSEVKCSERDILGEFYRVDSERGVNRYLFTQRHEHTERPNSPFYSSGISLCSDFVSTVHVLLAAQKRADLSVYI